MFKAKSGAKLALTLFVFAAGVLSGCNVVKTEKKTATLLKVEDAAMADLTAEVNRFARVRSIRAQMDLKFEDNSFAQFGNKEVYRAADGEIVVQRPGRILLNVKVPVIKTDVAQMTSDGKNFRVAILQDGGSGKYKKFVKGTNAADYSKLQQDLDESMNDGAIKQNVNAFANLRPQHFTDAMLVQPIDLSHSYTVSTIFQVEEDETAPKKSPLRKVNRGYYLLDEYVREASGDLRITRRFWFDRVGGIRLARQQIFDREGEIESDIVYGAEGTLGDTAEYDRLPLQIVVTRPREKYAMKLTYQVPVKVKIGNEYPETAFTLENSWGLEELDLDKKLQEVLARKPPGGSLANQNSSTRFH
ncbi:MAG: hypothetical protein IPM25_17050 [Chloracidobacterium sp.]|nr:hypothetical protein [Chloracidobacterium sp.]